MTTVFQVAMREVRERGRSKAFILASAFTLLLVVGMIVVPTLIDGGPSEWTVGTIGDEGSELVAAAEAIGNANTQSDEEPSVAIDSRSYDDEADARLALESDEVDIVLAGDKLITKTNGGFSGNPLANLLQRGAVSIELEEIVSQQGQAAADVIDLLTSEPLTTESLSGDDPEDSTKGLIAYGGLMLLYIAVLLYGTWILSGVTEEKSNRVVEVLLSSVRPWQLLGGKILGIGILGIGQFAGTVVLAVVALKISGAVELPEVPLVSIVHLVVWFVIGFLLFAVMFGAAGSLVSRMEDAQNVALPMSLTAVAGFFLSLSALDDPDGAAAIVGTFVPLTAPFVVPVRSALEAIPWWQYGMAVVLALAAIAGLTVVAGRIYAGGLLRYGGRVKLRDAWRSAGQ